jgi:hypothetical protein
VLCENWSCIGLSGTFREMCGFLILGYFLCYYRKGDKIIYIDVMRKE